MNKQALDICNTAETAGLVLLFFCPAYSLDASSEPQRSEDLSVVAKALTAYRVSREALLDYGIEMPKTPPLNKANGDGAQRIINAHANLRKVYSTVRQQVAELKDVSEAVESSSAYKLGIAQELLMSCYIREPLIEPHVVAAKFVDLRRSHAEIVAALESAKQLTGDETTALLLRSAEYFLFELNASHNELKREFAAYTEAIEENLNGEIKQPGLGDIFGALLEIVGGGEEAPKHGRVSTLSSHCVLAWAETAATEQLVGKASRLLAQIPQPEPETKSSDEVAYPDVPKELS